MVITERRTFLYLTALSTLALPSCLNAQAKEEENLIESFYKLVREKKIDNSKSITKTMNGQKIEITTFMHPKTPDQNRFILKVYSGGEQFYAERFVAVGTQPYHVGAENIYDALDKSYGKGFPDKITSEHTRRLNDYMKKTVPELSKQ